MIRVHITTILSKIELFWQHKGTLWRYFKVTPPSFSNHRYVLHFFNSIISRMMHKLKYKICNFLRLAFFFFFTQPNALRSIQIVTCINCLFFINLIFYLNSYSTAGTYRSLFKSLKDIWTVFKLGLSQLTTILVKINLL